MLADWLNAIFHLCLCLCQPCPYSGHNSDITAEAGAEEELKALPVFLCRLYACARPSPDASWVLLMLRSVASQVTTGQATCESTYVPAFLTEQSIFFMPRSGIRIFDRSVDL